MVFVANLILYAKKPPVTFLDILFVYIGGVFNMIFIVINGISDPSSNPG